MSVRSGDRQAWSLCTGLPMIGGIMLGAIRSAGNVTGWGLGDEVDTRFDRDGD